MDQLYSDTSNFSVYTYDGNDNIAKFLNEMVNYISAGSADCPPHLIGKYYRFFTIITLKYTLYHTVQNILVHSNHDKISAALSIVVSTILPILKNTKDKED